MEFPVSLYIPQLHPVKTTPREIASTIVDNMLGSVESGILEAENDQIALSPSELVIQGVRVTSSPSANRLQILQNKSGVVALLDDTYLIQDTVILPEGLVSVDWDMGKNFMCVLSADRQSAFYMTHSRAGMERNLLIINEGTKQTIGAFDPSILWPAGTAPTMPAASAGSSALLLVMLRNVNGLIYGESSTYTVGSGGFGHHNAIGSIGGTS